MSRDPDKIERGRTAIVSGIGGPIAVMMRDRESIVRELRTRAQRGDTPAAVATWLVRELRAVDSQDLQVAVYMWHAFEVSIKALKEAADWVGLGHGGTRTDDELNLLLGPLVPRSGDREVVPYPDGSWRSPMHPLRPDLWPTTTPGLRLSMLEGARPVGSADAVEVVTPAR